VEWDLDIESTPAAAQFAIDHVQQLGNAFAGDSRDRHCVTSADGGIDHGPVSNVVEQVDLVESCDQKPRGMRIVLVDGNAELTQHVFDVALLRLGLRM